METLFILHFVLLIFCFLFIWKEIWFVYLPVVEHRQSEGLSLCVCAKVRLKAEGVDGRDESLNGVERRPWDRCILGDVTPVR